MDSRRGNRFKILFQSRKKRQYGNVIRKIKISDSQIAQSDSDILKEAHRFYTDLYSSNNISLLEINQYIDSISGNYTVRQRKNKL